MTKTELFNTAWNTARAAAAKFGGSARQFFSESLKMAWAGAESAQSVAEKLISKGGKLWEKGGRRRVYVPVEVAMAAAGLVISSYKSGQPKAAEMNGEKISNSLAWDIKMALSDLFYDDVAGSFSTAGGKRTASAVAAAIRGLAA